MEFVEGLIFLMEALFQRAEEHRSTVMPGYTHHQHAVVTTFGHLLLSLGEALQRDVQRFAIWFALFNINPLGAAAGYGTTFNLDRQLTWKLLGFDEPTENVTDPITQRWEAEAELAYAIDVMLDHLSSMAQTLILLSTHEFGMVRLDDRHSFGQFDHAPEEEPLFPGSDEGKNLICPWNGGEPSLCWKSSFYGI